MHEDYFSMAGEHQVGPTGEAVPVQPEAIAQTMRYPPHEKLWFRSGCRHTRHDCAALLLAVYVSHRMEPLRRSRPFGGREEAGRWADSAGSARPS